MDYRRKLMGCSALLGAWLLVPNTVAAQSISDAEKIQKLERQTELLQKQSDCCSGSSRRSRTSSRSYGRVAVGAEYEYIKREVFAGLGGAPSADNNIVLTSIRYYPF
jgi:hypothetical protein